jgi:hypothetical protein
MPRIGPTGGGGSSSSSSGGGGGSDPFAFGFPFDDELFSSGIADTEDLL